MGYAALSLENSAAQLANRSRHHERPGFLVTASPGYSFAPLFVPGDRPDRFPKAAASGADGIIIDLEDAVTPAAKTRARDAVAAADLPADIVTFIRINPRHTPWYAEDLALVATLPGVGIMLPKVESTAQIEAALRSAGTGHPVIALIESAAGIAHARAIADAPGVNRLAFGVIDYCADLGCAALREALLMPRTELVLASRLAGLAPPLDGVSTDLEHPDACAEEARYGATLGFGGKLCIHPSQVLPVLAGFTPSEQELAWARRLLALENNGAAVVDGQMVDAAVLRRARGILERYPRLTAISGRVIQE